MEGLLRGIYRYRPAPESKSKQAHILASGVAGIEPPTAGV